MNGIEIEIIDKTDELPPPNGVFVASAFKSGELRLRFRFSDGFEREVDFEQFFRRSPKLFGKYLKEENFAKFTVQDGNVNWGDYDVIFRVEDLYKGTL